MSNISLKLDESKIIKLKETFKDDIKKSPNEYIDTFISRDDLTISIYNSGKVLFQGADAFFYAQSYLEIAKNPQAGSDEVGTGDFFGPMVVAASIIEESDYPLIEKLGITDSKEMSDDKIKNVAPILLKNIKHSLLIVDNKIYNIQHEKYNLNALKALCHNKAFINLKNKGYTLPKACYVDEFCSKENYYKYLANEKEVFHDLTFETKAEGKYPAVAVSSVIARYTFLMKMAEMEQKYKMSFHKGVNQDVINDGKHFIKTYGKDRLNEVCKLHFKTLNEIIN